MRFLISILCGNFFAYTYSYLSFLCMYIKQFSGIYFEKIGTTDKIRVNRSRTRSATKQINDHLSRIRNTRQKI